ncbi:NAD(P)H-binding protein [Flagellimonas sp. 389]|uniref:NAD(P)H-binding protein n=1 Tax=Flagellimonas sp. 389 TaxID=2835862 RepID=UPI001BD5486E|nr:NAD(P)H-binding protein [Flagellimonas sp. 389]MBS9464031.1 NAD(P)H-binding protein [Flagellimonas sp. 389]
MKVLVIGSTGRVGRLLTEKLLEQGHTVVGTSRGEERLFESDNYNQINLNLLDDTKDIVNTIPKDVGAVYFVSGSRGKDLFQVDLHGAIKTMQAAEELNIPRYILLSTLFALDTSKWHIGDIDQLRDYYVSKHYADQWLTKNTGLNYSILQPGNLKEVPGTGRIDTNVEEMGDNSITDVADTLAELLEAPSSYKKVITMHSGKTPIAQAIGEL